jgi:DNA-binding response OmpR family regulator
VIAEICFFAYNEAVVIPYRGALHLICTAMQNNTHAHLLLVDDDADTRSIYAEFLKEAGFDVQEAGDGLEGLEKANQIAPDLIVTGIIMPRLDGFGLVEALKRNVITAHIPVVFLSHLGREEDQLRSKQIGVKDFIVRDMTSPNEVVSRIKAMLNDTEYMLGIDPFNYDAAKFANDFNLNPDFLCSERENGKLVLKVRLREASSRKFDAELTCL